ncbi:hypothetical protein FIBSPDRAFT_591419 [Athelia psychrophila]|uniref:Uncharacterized protein n=1 Tax=Athelia psychrophila TaxID=1759441 RepID=A0A166H2L5_9AGAM|nr:hypothetical protein FIBSPDRAFT_591419 [Fibularhizoctonia sp. CBS 109695]
MSKHVARKDTAKSKAQLPRSSPQPRRSNRLSAVATSLATTSSTLEKPEGLERTSIQTSRSWGKSKAKSSPPPPSQRSIVLAGVSSPTVATSSALQVPATVCTITKLRRIFKIRTISFS